MPVMINEVVTEFEPENRQAGRPESSAGAQTTAPSGDPMIQQLAEMQALLQTRRQRLEVD